jgi:hypothetical protein
MALNDEGRGAGDGLMAKVRDEARRVALDEINRRLNNTVVGGRLNWDMLTQWGHHLLDGGTEVPIRPKLDLVGFTVADDPTGDLTRVTGGGGGGGGGMTKVAEVIVGSSDHFQGIRLPVTGTIPTGKHLLLMGQARTRIKEGYGGTPATATNIWVSYNDDPIDGAETLPAVFYSWEWHSHDADNGIHLPEFTNSDIGIEIGYCSGPASPANYCSSYRVEFQNFSGTAFQNGCTFQSLLQERDTASRIAYEGGGYRRGPEAITSLTVFTNSAYEFAPGTIWSLYLLGGTGSGGIGGVWTQLDQRTAVGGEGTLDFTSVPPTYDALVAVGDNICAETDTTSAGVTVMAEFNEWDGSDYIGREHYFRDIGSGDQHGMSAWTGSQAIEVGRASWSAVGGSGSFVAWFPGYTKTGQYKNVHSQGTMAYGNGTYSWETGGFARLGSARSDVIDHLRFFMGAWSGSPSRTFAAGSRITLYGLKAGG